MRRNYLDAIDDADFYDFTDDDLEPIDDVEDNADDLGIDDDDVDEDDTDIDDDDKLAGRSGPLTLPLHFRSADVRTGANAAIGR